MTDETARLEAVGRLGIVLTACARCGVARADRNHPTIRHTFEGMTARQAERLVDEEAARS